MPGGVKPPFEVILTWRPNYVDPETRGPFANILFLTLLAICWVVVALRVYARGVHTKSYGADDTLIVFSLIPVTGMTASMYIGMTAYGWDRHAWDVPLKAAYGSRKVGMAAEHCYNAAMLLVKVSILLLYRRLTALTSKTMLWIIYGLIAAFVALAIAIAIGFTIQCLPVESIWLSIDPFWRLQHEGEYYCINEGAFVTALSVINVVQDFIVFALPIPVILKLQITIREKIGVVLLFSVGFFLCICGIFRTIAVVKTFFQTYDSTWAFYDAYLWAGVEANVAVIIASLPSLNHFFRSVAKKTVSRITSRTRSSRNWPRSVAGSSLNRHDRSNSKSTNTQVDDEMEIELQRKGSAQIHVVHEFSMEEDALERKTSESQKSRDGVEAGSGTLLPVNLVPQHVRNDTRQTWWSPDSSSEEDLRQDHKSFPGMAV